MMGVIWPICDMITWLQTQPYPDVVVSSQLIKFGEFHLAPFAAAPTDDGDDDKDDINMLLM